MCVKSVSCNESLSVLSSFTNHLGVEERAGCFLTVSVSVFVSLPRSAVDRSVVCDCDTSYLLHIRSKAEPWSPYPPSCMWNVKHLHTYINKNA